MGTKVNSNYESLLTFTRASGGHALRPVSYGDELVTNGTFDADSNWVKGSSWSIADGVATTDGTVGGATLRQELTNTNIGDLLLVQYTVSNWNSTGTHNALLGTSSSRNNTGNGTFYVALIQNGDKEINIQTKGNAAFDVDNISVKEVLFDQPDGTLTLFEHPDNVPRVEYDADGNRLGLLVEESRTNLFTESERLSEKDHDMTTSDNAAIAPDRNQSASFCKPTTFATEHYIDDVGVIAGTDYAVSCFAKQGSGDYLLAFRGSGIGGDSPRFNLATGTIDNEGASSVWSNTKIEDVGNGWYRCSAIGNPNNTTPLRFQITESDGTVAFAGDGTSGLYIWGCQIELASFPTSYIKTTGSTATRSADVASIPVADFGYNQSAGTVVVTSSIISPQTSQYNAFVQLVEDTNNRIDLGVLVNDGWQSIRTGGVDTAKYYTDGHNANIFDAGEVAITALAFSPTSTNSSANGSLGTEDTSSALPTAIQTLKIGVDHTSRYANGHIKSIKYYPRRLSDAQLQDLTS